MSNFPKLWMGHLPIRIRLTLFYLVTLVVILVIFAAFVYGQVRKNLYAQVDSALEIAAIRVAIPDPDFLIITPGVRPAGASAGDQARVMTPGDAIRAGASYLVVGRPITGSADPSSAAEAIALEIAEAM